MDRRQFNRIVDVGRQLSSSRPCGHRFGCAVAKAAAQGTAICDLKIEPVDVATPLDRQLIADGNRLAEMCDCFGICGALQRLLARLAPPLQGYLAQPGFSKMVCHDFRLGLGNNWKLVAQDIADLLMEQLPAALEQALVGRLLNKRMFKAIASFRRCPPAQQELGLFQLPQCAVSDRSSPPATDRSSV